MTSKKFALLSVSDKTGIVELAQGLVQRGYTVLSTGGTSRLLNDHGVSVTDVSEHTGFPEMLDGRVKTLHPKVHGGLLARRDLPEHVRAIEAHGIDPIDVVVVNLYPFQATIAKKDCTFEDAIENIDIGGPTMLRAAAKNFRDVTVVIDPSDYPDVLAHHEAADPSALASFRERLAKKVFVHTAQYDAAIANYLTGLGEDHQRSDYPTSLNLSFELVQAMRYGENPHQSAAFYREVPERPGSLAQFVQLQGKALSYNNIADADAAWQCVQSFEDIACVIIKHANPCGVAVGTSALAAYEKAFKTDPTSAFGGIIAFNRDVDEAAAQAVSRQFVEVVIAPHFSAEAKAVFAPRQNVRLIEIPRATYQPGADYKRVSGGLLVQSPDDRSVTAQDLRVVTQRQPTPVELADLLFAWRVAKYVKSNAIVFAGNGMTLGVGAGQMSRVDSAKIASIKAAQAKLDLTGSAVASDAFFPFRDGLDVVIDAGATAVVQPGGSVRDDEVIAAANERGICMVFSGVRHFRH